MIVERTDKEIIIRIPVTANADDLQDFIDYVGYKEIVSGINVPQEVIDKLASDFNKNWWRKNRERFNQ